MAVKQLAAGLRHSLALTQRGDVYSWGFSGRTGGVYDYIPFAGISSPIGHNNSNFNTPQLIENFKEDITQISAGRDLSLAVGASGKVYGWGELSPLSMNSSSTPVDLE